MPNETIAIVDSGIGNLKSIANMLSRIGVASRLVSRPEEVALATKILLPGVGAFDAGMAALHERGLVDVLNERACVAKVPILGICLGMQLLAEASEEGERQGLGWIPGCSQRFSFPETVPPLRVPHMGWNTVIPSRECVLLTHVPMPRRFYFVHSYHVVCRDPADVLATTSYGIPFVSAVARGNIMGVQFHPEKSHKYGMALLRAFAELA
ncbi:MAG: imidazole glycerol phosphate synthase subunit HisH [Candidatus Bipolaricaulota bacterium]